MAIPSPHHGGRAQPPRGGSARVCLLARCSGRIRGASQGMGVARGRAVSHPHPAPRSSCTTSRRRRPRTRPPSATCTRATTRRSRRTAPASRRPTACRRVPRPRAPFTTSSRRRGQRSLRTSTASTCVVVVGGGARAAGARSPHPPLTGVSRGPPPSRGLCCARVGKRGPPKARWHGGCRERGSRG